MRGKADGDALMKLRRSEMEDGGSQFASAETSLRGGSDQPAHQPSNRHGFFAQLQGSRTASREVVLKNVRQRPDFSTRRAGDIVRLRLLSCVPPFKAFFSL